MLSSYIGIVVLCNQIKNSSFTTFTLHRTFKRQNDVSILYQQRKKIAFCLIEYYSMNTDRRGLLKFLYQGHKKQILYRVDFKLLDFIHIERIFRITLHIKGLRNTFFRFIIFQLLILCFMQK